MPDGIFRVHDCANHGIAIFGPLDLEARPDAAGGGAIKVSSMVCSSGCEAEMCVCAECLIAKCSCGCEIEILMLTPTL